MAFIRPVAAEYPICRFYGEAGPHFSWHINEQTGLWIAGQCCSGCQRCTPCTCLTPSPGGNHTGTDFACPENTPVVAMAAGMIIRIGPDKSEGYQENSHRIVQLVSEPGFDSWWLIYRHLQMSHVSIGDRVRPGDRLGYSGRYENEMPFVHVELLDRRHQFRPIPLDS